MKYSAQAIVVDTNRKLYFEDNQVTGMLSFIGGKLDLGESYEQAVIREIKEELGVIISEIRLLDGQQQPVRTFWNERKQAYIDWQSKYFVVVLSGEEVEILISNVKLIVLETIEELSKFGDEKFLPLGREVFIEQINRALSYV